ncbi:MAG: T9SS type A sorting domain-containing protein [Ignavibacteriaceae bacterium]|nr:T9SS type A sorting domain-containing protein [Ignavibacteriaceae bacterium]
MKVIFISIVLLILNGIRVYSQPLSKQIFPSSNPQTEISIAIDPTNPQNILVSCNGGWEIVYPPSPPSQNNPADQPYELIFRQPCFYSVDAGNSWSAANQDFAPNGIETRGDPVVFYNTYGDAFYVTMGKNGGILVLKSIDKGGAWGATINADPLNKKDDDKPHAVADLSETFPNNVYVAWTDFDTYEVILTKSIDRGEHFGNRQVIFPNTNSVVMGVNLQPGPNGELYCIAAKYLDPASQDRHEKSFIFTKSTDGGNTFTNPASIFNISGIRSSNSLFNGARVNSWPSMSVDRSNSIRRGWIYVVYADMHIGDADIYLRRSTDGGNSWSSEIRVNQDPAGTQQFFSSACVDPVSGNIYVSYYNMDGQNYQSSRYLAVSTDGGNTFSRSIVSDSRTELYPQIDNMGDYYETAAYNDIVYATWSQYNTTSNIYQAFINYPPNVIVDQKIDQNSSSIGQVGFWENNQFNEYSIPKIKKITSSTLTLRAAQQVINNNDKYSFWKHDFVSEPNVKNHNSFSIHEGANQFTSILLPFYSNISIKNNLEQTTVDGGKINFKDPWYIDSVDNSLIGANRLNRGNDVVWRERFSPFTPNGTNLFAESIYPYNGVFLDQSGPPFWNPPYYTVKVTSPQPISLNGRTHTFYFQNWSGTEVQFENASALQTGVVFKDNIPGVDPIVSANYKGHFLSNSSTALANNGQRKVVRDKNGFYHMVYESMNYIWYSKSLTTNYQGEWTPDVKLIDYGPDVIFSNPSIDVNSGIFAPDIDEKLSIVFEGYVDAVEAAVAVVTKNITSGVVNSSFVVIPIDPLYFGSAKPVVASFGDEIFVVYKYSASSPLYYSRYYLNGGTWTQIVPVILPNTNSSSVNPSVASNSSPQKSDNLVQIVWQQGTSIKHESSKNSGILNPGSERTFIYKDVSFGAGNTWNLNPTVIDYNGAAKIAWLGSRRIVGGVENRTTYREISSSGNPSVFSNFGSNVNFPTISSAGGYNGFILGWGANNGADNYFVDEGLSFIYPLNITGKDLQLCSGAGKSTMFATSFTNSALPYYFTQSNDIQSLYNIAKTNSSGINKGREGVVAKGSGEIYFTIGDVNVNGENISFKALPDSFTVNSADDVNNNVRTIPFALTNDSQLFYSVQYGITDSLEIANSFSNNDAVFFRIELVDEATETVLGVFDEVSFTKQQAVPYENFSCQVSTEGIGNRTVYLRLATTATEGCYFSLANLLDNQNIIAKKNIKQLTYKSAAVIKDYALEQNYPNPFNPVTTINYQLPKSGTVTLKIFDILGKEVKTLVDEQKEMGKYTVQFDASSLASGMYVYQLRVNDYTSTKKMMLLK